MPLIFVTKDFAVDPDDVSALEKYDKWDNDPSLSGSSWIDHSGTMVIQKNGRKTYLREISVKDCHQLIFGTSEPRTPEVEE